MKVKEGNRARGEGEEKGFRNDTRRVAKGKEKREMDLLRDRLRTIIGRGSFLLRSSLDSFFPNIFIEIFAPTVLYRQVSIQRAPPLPLTCSFCCKGSSLRTPLFPPLCTGKRIPPFSISIGVSRLSFVLFRANCDQFVVRGMWNAHEIELNFRPFSFF